MPIPKEELQTRFASEARALAEAFGSSLGQTRVAGDWRPDLVAPDVPSTAGGALATVHLKLVPPDGPALVVGHANPKEGAAELRTFDHADRLHRDRFGASIGIARQDYDKFLDDVQKFFEEQHLAVKRVGPPSLPPPSVPPPGRRFAPVIVLVVAALVLAALFLWLKR